MENIFKNKRRINKTAMIITVAVLFFVVVGEYRFYQNRVVKRVFSYDELVNLAREAAKAENLPESIDYYREAMSLEASNNQAKSELATVYIKNQNFDEAIALLEEVIKTDESNSFALNNLGNAHRDKGEDDLAEKYYQLSIARGNIDSVGNVVTMYNNAGEYEKSISILNTLINGGKNDDYFLRLLASSYSKSGNETRANEILAEIE